jgi:non-heme chloroperoxidase
MDRASDPLLASVEKDVTLAYRMLGEGPLTLLFMHGWAGSGAYFDEVVSYLDLRHLRAITYDLRGHGASDKPRWGYSLERFAQDALAVANHAQAEKLVIIGFSMSAKFAQYIACAYPSRVQALILMGGLQTTEIPFPPEIHDDWVSRAGNMTRLIELTQTYCTQPVSETVINRWAVDAIKVPRFVLDETLRLCLQTSFSDRVDRLQMPALVIGGKHDTLFTPNVLAQSVVAPLPCARLAILDCNHELALEKPLEVAGLINAFVAGLGCE